MKRMNHKLLAVLLALTLSLTLLAGCGGNNNSQNSSGSTDGNQSQNSGSEDNGETGNGGQEASAFVFTSNGVEVRMNAEADPIVEALGEPVSTFEAPSCAFQGTDYIYTYDGFQINTYPLNDVNYVSSVVFMSDAVSTPEGLEIGKTKDDMIAAYGEDYTEEYDQYTYTRGDSQLVVLIEDGYISSIEYQAVLPEQNG